MYLQIANVNNCLTFATMIKKLANDYLPSQVKYYAEVALKYDELAHDLYESYTDAVKTHTN